MKHYDNINKLRRNNRLLAIFIISFVIGGLVFIGFTVSGVLTWITG